MVKHQVISNAQAALRVGLSVTFSALALALTNFNGDDAGGLSLLLSVILAFCSLLVLLKLPVLLPLQAPDMDKLQIMLASCPAVSRVIVIGLLRGHTLRYRDFIFVGKAFIDQVAKNRREKLSSF